MWHLQLHTDGSVATPRATDDQIKKAAALMRRIDLKDFSVCQFANPGNIAFEGSHFLSYDDQDGFLSVLCFLSPFFP